jgi:hypothetical protein
MAAVLRKLPYIQAELASAWPPGRRRLHENLVTGAQRVYRPEFGGAAPAKPGDVRCGVRPGQYPAELAAWLAQADFVFHLAGVNRPQTEDEFQTGNVDFTAQVCERLLALGRPTPLVLSSSIQAELDNPYGQQAPGGACAGRYAEQSGARCRITG